MSVSVEILVAPSIEPITISDMKSYLNVDYSDSDSLIASFIVYARRYAERMLNLALAPQTIRATFNPPQGPRGQLSGPVGADTDLYQLNERLTTIPFGFYGPVFSLPYHPASAISVVEYQLTPFDGTGATMQWTTLSVADSNGNANYLLDSNTTPRQIVMRPLLVASRYRVTYTAGYGDTSTPVCPETIADCLKSIASWKFDNRQGQKIPQDIIDALARERIFTL